MVTERYQARAICAIHLERGSLKPYLNASEPNFFFTVPRRSASGVSGLIVGVRIEAALHSAPMKVSAYVPCYNAKGTVREAVRSIVDQTVLAAEIFVLDDG